jgi:Ca2+-transporting ATPase
LLLVVAAVIAFFVGEITNTYILLIIVVINTVLGSVQEYRAEKALESLKRILPLKVKVIRDGQSQEILAWQLVPGDLVIIESGDKVPADLEVVKESSLKVNQAVVTGESLPVDKSLGEEMYSGSVVVSGHGQAVVTAIGAKAKVGKIASHLSVQDELTPLAKRLNYLGKVLAIIAGLLSAIIFIFGLFKGMGYEDILIYSISILVSAVPESLPIVTTLALALGVIKMSRYKAVVRHLQAIETLGTINVIASDKTGTLTRNELTAKEIWTSEGRYQVEGTGYLPRGKIVDKEGDLVSKDRLPVALEKTIFSGVWANNAQLTRSDGQDWQVIGDPTEGSLLVLAKKVGLLARKDEVKVVDEISFNSERKMMSVIIDEGRDYFLYSKGAPEVILEKSKSIQINGKSEKLTDESRERWLNNAQKMAQRGFRVLAFGYKRTSRFNQKEDGLIFTGLVGMIDPPLSEASQALEEAKILGIDTIIITGDHKLTAKWVTNQLGFKLKDNQIMTGDQLDNLSDEELLDKITKVKLWARITPDQKKRLVEKMKERGWSVAVTGDGVNDAPALKKADVGIAMGRQGTDVAIESADVVLEDDRFSSIIWAVKYGRTIYDNIKKFLTFLLSGNFDEIMLVTIAFAFSLPQPFTAGQILWINLITDSFPAMALAFESPGENISQSKPREPDKGIIRPIIKYAMFIGGIALAFSLILLIIFQDIDHSRLQTYIFTLAVFIELFAVFAVRSNKPFWQENPFKNKLLVLAVIFSVILQLIAIYSPISSLLQTKPLVAWEWGMIILISAVSYLIIELVKHFKPEFLTKA